MSTSLTQLITEKHVVLGARPQTWQDAIRLTAAQPPDAHRTRRALNPGERLGSLNRSIVMTRNT